MLMSGLRLPRGQWDVIIGVSTFEIDVSLNDLDSREPISPRIVALVPCSCHLTNNGLEPSHSIEAVFGNEGIWVGACTMNTVETLPLHRERLHKRPDLYDHSLHSCLKMADNRTWEFDAPRLPDSSDCLGTVEGICKSTSFRSLVPGQSGFGDTW